MFHIFHRTLAVAALASMALASLGPRSAEASLVSLCGPTICYEYDNDPGVNAGITAFGNPSLLGNSDFLEFTPTGFSALSSNGGLTTTTATFQFSRVYTLNGGEITFIGVSDSGDFRIINGGSVSNTIRLQSVDQVNNNPTPGFPEVYANITNFTSSTVTGFIPQNWSLSNLFSPAAVFDDLASSIDLQIQNTLDAFTSGSGQQAWIQKKLVLVSGSGGPPTVVPVPAAAWLFGSAFLALGGLRRRRV
jgi:hypothetical protein